MSSADSPKTPTAAELKAAASKAREPLPPVSPMAVAQLVVRVLFVSLLVAVAGVFFVGWRSLGAVGEHT